MASSSIIEVVAAAKALLEDDKYHDVRFVCRDGAVVAANRAFIAARCSYFERLLYGHLKESSSSEVALPRAMAPALRHVLRHLHTGELPTSEGHWPILMDTCGLAQMYMLPDLVAHVAERVGRELAPRDLGTVLSAALQEDLDPVVRRVWLALPRLLPRPLTFRSSGAGDPKPHPRDPGGGAAVSVPTSTFSPAAVAFVLERTIPHSGGGGGTAVTAVGAVTGASGGTTVPAGGAASGSPGYTGGPANAWAALPPGGPLGPSRLPSRSNSSGLTAALAGSAGAGGSGWGGGANALPRRSADGGGGAVAAVVGSGSGGRGGSSAVQDEEQLLAAVLEWTHAACQVCAHCHTSSTPGGARGSAAEGASASTTSGSAPTLPAAAGACHHHQQLLASFLVRLDWQLLGPSALEALEVGGLLAGDALLEVYRAQHRCLHGALAGRVSLPPLCDGLRRLLGSAGEEVLECSAVPHVTASTSAPLRGGRHCWEVRCHMVCDLVWVGVSDGTLDPTCWGGKQAGGWFLGSNDALCHSAQSDKHAYNQLCGVGKFGDGAVITVFLDLDLGEIYFAVDGCEPRLGFSGLPRELYPSVSVRAPAQLGFRFRPSSWWLATSAGGSGSGEGASELMEGEGRGAGDSSSDTQQ